MVYAHESLGTETTTSFSRLWLTIAQSRVRKAKHLLEYINK